MPKGSRRAFQEDVSLSVMPATKRNCIGNVPMVIAGTLATTAFLEVVAVRSVSISNEKMGPELEFAGLRLSREK